MFVAIFLLLLAILGGTILTFLYDHDTPLLVRLCMGACTGMALMTTIGFAVASFLGLNARSIGVAAVALFLPVLLLINESSGQAIRAEVKSGFDALKATSNKVFVAYAAFFVAMAMLLGMIFSHAVYQNPDGIFTGDMNNLGDLPFHMGIISGFVEGHNFPPQDPAFANVKFNYPFLADFLVAMMVSAGAPMTAAIGMENMLLGISMVGLIAYWTVLLTKNRVAGLIAPLLVIFSGSMGWWQILDDVRHSDHGLFPLLLNLQKDYTIANGSIFRWGNSITCLFVPQRSILFGIPLCLCIFCMWWRAQDEQEGEGVSLATRRMAAAGAMAGLLPLIHAHSFIVVMGMAGCLALIFNKQWRAWLLFFAVALVIAAPEILWNMHGSSLHSKEFLAVQYWWDHDKYNPVWFWFVNAGPFMLLLLLALFWRSNDYRLPKRLLLFYAPFTLCFIGPNVLRLAPWVWDNIKVLFYWYVASAPLVALMLAYLWRTPGKRWIAAGLFATLTLGGALDIIRVVTGASQYQEYGRDEIALAREIEQHTEPRAIVLHNPTYNPPIYLTGRRSLLGYPGIIWSRGLGDYSDRENAIHSIYAGNPDAEYQIRRWNVGYVELGPLERGNSELQINDNFWSRFPVVAQAGNYRLYKVGPAQ